MTPTRIANPKYSRYTPDGRADNPEWKHPKSGVDLWTALIADPSQPASEKDRAAQFLKWFLTRWAEHEERINLDDIESGREDYPGRAEHNHTVARMTVEAGYLYCFWESPDQYAFSIVKGVDGVERQDVVPIKSLESEPDPEVPALCRPSSLRFHSESCPSSRKSI